MFFQIEEALKKTVRKFAYIFKFIFANYAKLITLIVLQSQLIKPFLEIKFDPFLAANQRLWGALLEQLRKDVQVLELEAKNLIDEAFVTKFVEPIYILIFLVKLLKYWHFSGQPMQRLKC